MPAQQVEATAAHGRSDAAHRTPARMEGSGSSHGDGDGSTKLLY